MLNYLLVSSRVKSKNQIHQKSMDGPIHSNHMSYVPYLCNETVSFWVEFTQINHGSTYQPRYGWQAVG